MSLAKRHGFFVEGTKKKIIRVSCPIYYISLKPDLAEPEANL